MKGTLIKSGNNYYLEQIPSKGIGGAVLEMMMGSTDGEGYYKLSKQNCDEIFGVVDVEKLASEVYEDDWDDKGRNLGRTLQYAFEEGFNKAIELNKDKQFTLEDVRNAMDWIMTQYFEFHEQPTTGRREHYLESLQKPTEIEVEIEMIQGMKVNGIQKPFPVKNSNGCLILKKL
jgi:hypothetical protein